MFFIAQPCDAFSMPRGWPKLFAGDDFLRYTLVWTSAQLRGADIYCLETRGQPPPFHFVGARVAMPFGVGCWQQKT